ncbi:MAG: polysaccharide pyruvyl transferase family protein [Ignisphaera sp.]
MSSINKKRIVVFGPVSPNNIGDAIQQIVAAHLVKNFLPTFDVTLMAPFISKRFFNDVDLRITCVSPSNIRLFATYNIIKDKIFHNRCQSNCVTEENLPGVDLSSSLYNMYTRILPYIFPISEIDKCVALSTLEGYLYSTGFIAGHTISTPSVYHYVFSYEILRKMVTGFVTTFPLSISINAFKMLSEWNRRHVIKKLKRIFFDSHVFVRGPVTLSFMKEVVGLENVEMALDSGFGIKELIPRNFHIGRRDAKYVVIAPRRHFHYYYRKINQYQHYLNLISNIIVELTEDEGYHVYLLAPMSFLDAVNDILLVLCRKSKIPSAFLNKKISIVRPTNLIDICKILSSAEFVVTSYMHVGIISMSFGIPTLFLQPTNETKLLDIFYFLKIPPLMIDIFNMHQVKEIEIKEKLSFICSKAKTYYRGLIKQAVDKKYSTLYSPIKRLVKNLNL